MMKVKISFLLLSERSRKRRRTEVVDIEDRLESLITRVGEKVSITITIKKRERKI